MNMKNKRKAVRIISFLAAFAVALGAWAIVSTVNAVKLKNEIRVTEERALNLLGTYLDDINLNLQKAMYLKSDNMLSRVSVDLWRAGASAKESLSEITDSNTEVSALYKFLSQVGEYTLSLNEKIANNQELTKEETQNLNSLLKYSEVLAEKVNELKVGYEEGSLDFREVKTTLQKADDEKLYLGNELNDTTQALGDYPTLIYDGPFSDHISNKKSLVTDSLKKVSESEAKKKASEFLGIKEDELLFLNKTDNNMSTYTFYSQAYTISVTQKGGIVSSFITDKYASEIKLTTKSAIKKATEFLNEKGYNDIKESYYSTTDGIMTVNFSYYKNGITYYTDLIKVSVSLDNGTITAFDATGYLMNHTQRDIPTAKYTLKQGASLLKENLTVLSYKKTFIPTEWETEEFAYEYHCKASDGKEVLIYIDPKTGEEVNILILLYTDGGVLTK